MPFRKFFYKRFFFILILCLAFSTAHFSTVFAENRAGINIAAKYEDFDKSVNVVGTGGWVIVLAGGTGDCEKLNTFIPVANAADINLVIRGHLNNQLSPQDAMAWAATLGQLDTSKRLLFVPWNEPNLPDSPDYTDYTTLSAYTNALLTYSNQAGIRGKVAILSPALSMNNGNRETYISQLGGASYFKAFDGISMNLYDVGKGLPCGTPLCNADMYNNPGKANEILNSLGGASISIITESGTAHPAPWYYDSAIDHSPSAGSALHSYVVAYKDSGPIPFAIPSYDLAGEVGHSWSLFANNDTTDVLGSFSKGSAQGASFDGAAYKGWVDNLVTSGELVPCMGTCGYAHKSNPGLCKGTGGISGPNLASCEEPKEANPEPGCYDCNLSNDLSGNICDTSNPFIGYICKQLQRLTVSFTGTIEVDDVKSPIVKEHLDTWYGTVNDSAKIEDGEEGRLFYFLTPEQSQTARLSARVAKDTKTKITYDARVEGLNAKSGYGSTIKYVYGTQNTTALINCMMWGSQDNTECKNATPNFALNLENETLAVNMEAQAEAARPTSIATEETSKATETATDINVAVNNILTEGINTYGKETLLASLTAADAKLTPTQNSGSVLAAEDGIFVDCPERKDTPQTTVCKLAVEKPIISGKVSQEKECETSYTAGGDGLPKRNTDDCSFSVNRRASFAPQFHFATGEVPYVTGSLPGVIPSEEKIHSFFYAPEFALSEQTRLKKKNDGKVDFKIHADIIQDANKLGLLGNMLNKVVAAILQVKTNDGQKATVENAKKADCMEKITTGNWTKTPDQAAPLDPECTEPIPPPGAEPGVAIPGQCENGEGGIVTWTNNTTNFKKAENLQGPAIGHLCGFIRLRDPANPDSSAPLNPCSNATTMGCGAPKQGGYRIVRKTCSPKESPITINDQIFGAVSVQDPKDCIDLQRRVTLAMTMDGKNYREFNDESANACLANFSCTPGKYEDIGNFADGSLNHIFLNLDLPTGPIDAPEKTYIYRLDMEKFCYVSQSSPPFYVDPTQNMCVNVSLWSSFSVPDSGDSAEFCGASSNCGSIQSKIDDCGDRLEDDDYDDCKDTNRKDDMCRIKCVIDPAFTRLYHQANLCNECPDIKNLTPVRLTDLRFYDVSCTDTTHCFAVANKMPDFGLDTGENGAYFAKTENGDDWTISALKYKDNEGTDLFPQSAYRVRFVNNTSGWLVGKLASGNDLILKTTDAGETWTRQANEGLGPDLISLDMLNSNFGIVAPSNLYTDKKILATTNGGQGEAGPTGFVPSWKLQDIGFDNNRDSMIDIDIVNENRFMAAVNSGSVYIFNKNGNAWEPKVDGLTKYHQFSGCGRMEKIRASGDTAYTVGRNSCLGYYNGDTWLRLQGTQTGTDLFGLDSWNEKGIATGTGGKVYRVYRDGGMKVEDYSPTSLTSEPLMAVGMPSPDVIYILGDKGTILKSTQDATGTAWGTKWKKIDTSKIKLENTSGF